MTAGLSFRKAWLRSVKNHLLGRDLSHIKKPIIVHDGTFDITLQDGARGLVSQDILTIRLFYEIQSPIYPNPDVVTDLCKHQGRRKCRTDYKVLRIYQYGSPVQNARTKALDTCKFRVFAQSDEQETLATLSIILNGYGLGGYCGQRSCTSACFDSLVLKWLYIVQGL
ncbi:hypothetical protein LX32DRAFT_651820 [Colletotrichum zoysiae]|uniref:Acyclic terpene utilisation N-terminal domain-containing protein n=1 Tax=Colletotrichum zoysiae TaxID=1216348 RepID=A0AAD9HJJ7_9PEZI|nr:hypothetical protein LX32DRAFT_651820 [Colletotrichum zoysiae]